MSTDRRETRMRQIKALMAKANDPGVGEAERDAFLAGADRLMTQFQIEEFELDQLDGATGGTKRERPSVLDIEVPDTGNYDIRSALTNVFYSLADFTGCKVGQGHTQGGGTRTWKVVGYETDARYLQMLFLAIQLDIVRQMEPTLDPAKTDAENYAALREAGLPIERIMRKLGYYTGDARWWDEGDAPIADHATLSRFRRAYRALCKAKGVEPVKGLTGDSYREGFMLGYQTQLAERIRSMKAQRTEDLKGHELVVVGRDEEVQEAFYQAYPDLRPHPADCQCGDCHYRKCMDRECQMPRCKRYWADYNKPVRRYAAPKERQLNLGGYARGKQAGNNANLSRGSVGGGTQGELQ